MASMSSVSAVTAGQLSDQYLDSSVEYNAGKLHLAEFKPLKRRAIEAPVRRHDVFVSLRTG